MLCIKPTKRWEASDEEAQQRPIQHKLVPGWAHGRRLRCPPAVSSQLVNGWLPLRRHCYWAALTG